MKFELNAIAENGKVTVVLTQDQLDNDDLIETLEGTGFTIKGNIATLEP